MPTWPPNNLDMTNMTPSRILYSALFAAFAQPALAQIIWTEPAFPTQDDVVTLYYDISQGNAALLNEEPPCPPCPFVFAHTGVITSESDSPSDWQFVHNPWPSGNNLSQANAGNVLVPVSGTVHSFDFEGMTLAEYYGVPDGVVIEELAFVFRNATGTVVGKTSDESDIFYSVSDGSFDVVFTNPIGTSTLGAIGDTVTVVAQASQLSNLVLTVNDQEVSNVSGTTLSYDLILNTSGDYNLQVSAEAEGSTASNNAVVFVMPETPPVVTPPAGLVDGINHIDDSTVILQWTAPYKDFVFAVGDFNDWSLTSSSMMHATGNGETFWLELADLTPGQVQVPIPHPA